MARLGDDEIIDLSTSCTKDHAVLKLLGWSKGTFYPKFIHLDDDAHYLPNQLHLISHNTVDLRAQLQELLDQARQAYLKALPEQAYSESYDFEKNMPPEELDALLKKQKLVEDIRELIERAREMAMDIDEELEKGEFSQLRKDMDATEGTGVLHITLRSLERWQKVFYGPKPEPTEVPASQYAGLGDPDLMAQLSKAVAENKKGISDADLSLYITLGFAVEAIAEKVGHRYADKNEKPVISQIAELISVKYQSPDGTPLIRGQGLDMIRKRLTLAMKVKPDLPKPK